MKMSVRLVIFVSVLLVFFAGRSSAEEGNTSFWPLTGEFSAEGTYVGEGNVERGGKHVNDFDEIDSNLRFVLTPRTSIGVLRLGAEWERFSFGFPENTALPNTLQSFSTVIG